jgi:hypothetical protein
MPEELTLRAIGAVAAQNSASKDLGVFDGGGGGEYTARVEVTQGRSWLERPALHGRSKRKEGREKSGVRVWE